MKAKLTITVEKTLIPKSKLYAHTKGISLSQLIENTLEQAMGTHSQGASLPFSSRWMGRFMLSNQPDTRTLALKKRFHL